MDFLLFALFVKQVKHKSLWFNKYRSNQPPRCIRDGKCKADHASSALNKWVKKHFDGLTAHCLRHTFRDRLGAVECPMDMIDQIGGWRSVSSIGNNYGQGYSMEQITKWMKLVSL